MSKKMYCYQIAYLMASPILKKTSFEYEPSWVSRDMDTITVNQYGFPVRPQQAVTTVGIDRLYWGNESAGFISDIADKGVVRTAMQNEANLNITRLREVFRRAWHDPDLAEQMIEVIQLRRIINALHISKVH